ncbi:hypothetical protein ACO0K2_17855 [Undibacterium sp. MH2W]|uniref:hypothetical protein n=1 Tax=Undibacterium sp. MH2W TaxID=3413044 RepID=UPI003BF2D1AC
MKRDIPIHYHQTTPLDICLDLWVQWLRRDDNVGSMGFKGRDSILRADTTKNSEQLYDSQDMETAEAVDACVSSLKAQYAWAIKKRCNVASVWKFPQLNFSDVLPEAERELEKKLKNNLATWSYFT